MDGVKTWVNVPGYSLLDGTTSSNSSTVFIQLDDWDERLEKGLTIDHLIKEFYKRTYPISDATIFPFNPPAINGLGSTGGFQMVLQDLNANNYDKLFNQTNQFSLQAM